MIIDRYFTNEEFELKDLNKGFYFLIIGFPLLVFLLWGLSYTSYSDNQIRPIYLFIYTYFKYSVFLVIISFIYNKFTKIEYKNNVLSILVIVILLMSLILGFLSMIFYFRGENRDFIIDAFFITSLTIFIIYFIIYYFRYIKRAKEGREKYINELKTYNYIIDTQSQDIEHHYFRIKNKKLEEKLDILAIFIKILAPTITTITIFIGYKYIQNGENDPSIFIVALGGVLGSAYFGSLLALVIVAIVNLNQIEKQIGRKIYPGLYPKTIARKKAEAKENEEYWEKRLEEEENKKSKKENS